MPGQGFLSQGRVPLMIAGQMMACSVDQLHCLTGLTPDEARLVISQHAVCSNFELLGVLDCHRCIIASMIASSGDTCSKYSQTLYG
jgi:hypothetical protein